MTPAEIVKSLRCCAEIGECEKCVIDPEESWDTCRKRDAEAADLIERLEKENAALLELVRGGCTSCKYWSDNTIDCKVDKWIRLPSMGLEFECPACGRQYEWFEPWKENFCPGCGTKKNGVAE